MSITERAHARQLDADDELAAFREEFEIPTTDDGDEVLYLCGNSLGLKPRRTDDYVSRELDKWARSGVEGHFADTDPWYSYHELLDESLAAIVGARPREVVAMNSLTTNLHLLMVSFYRPTDERFKIMIEGGAFPSDRYAVASQASVHGYDPDEAIVEVEPREGEHRLRTEDIEAAIEEHGDELALVLFGGVNYYTGQLFDLERITELGHRVGANVGFDLAHAAGNVELELHDWGPDFAAWCSYKYLNAGPGAVAGIFVHDRHAESVDIPRFAGWWGTDPETRFEMGPEFEPQPGAAGWQLSNAPVLSMAALRASLSLFSEATMPALVDKSRRLTGYLFDLLQRLPDRDFEVITPTNVDDHGCQVSILAHRDAQSLHENLQGAGVVCDYRKPGVIRVAPVPLYNTFDDVWRFWNTLADRSR